MKLSSSPKFGFHDRGEAGRRLARKLTAYAGKNDVIVLGLPRGGVPVAWEVARSLKAPLDLLVVRKVGVRGNEEIAMGAVAAGGGLVTNDDVVEEMGVSRTVFEEAVEQQKLEVTRRERLYRQGRPPLNLKGKTAILVDDGVATGATLRAACQAARTLGAARVVAAVPVASPDAPRQFQHAADTFVCDVSMPFRAVGEAYENFAQVSDEEVMDLLNKSTLTEPTG